MILSGTVFPEFFIPSVVTFVPGWKKLPFASIRGLTIVFFGSTGWEVVELIAGDVKKLVFFVSCADADWPRATKRNKANIGKQILFIE